MGILRAALPLVDALGSPLLNADQEPPLADEEEHRLWSRVRRIQEILVEAVWANGNRLDGRRDEHSAAPRA